MTKQNKTIKTEQQEQEQKALDFIRQVLADYEQAKKDKKQASEYLKKENVVRLAHNVHVHAFAMFVKHNDKRGLVALYNSKSDLFNYYLRPFYKAFNLGFLELGGAVSVVSNETTDFNSLQDFQAWALAKIKENKDKQAKQKQDLAKVKTGVSFAKMDKKTLLAVILQARQELKAKEKDNA